MNTVLFYWSYFWHRRSIIQGLMITVLNRGFICTFNNYVYSWSLYFRSWMLFDKYFLWQSLKLNIVYFASSRRNSSQLNYGIPLKIRAVEVRRLRETWKKQCCDSTFPDKRISLSARGMDHLLAIWSFSFRGKITYLYSVPW